MYDSAVPTNVCRAFQARAVTTGCSITKCSLSVVGSVAVTSSVDVDPELRRRRDSTLDVRWSVSARYDGAMPWTQQYARTHKRSCIRSGTFSQCVALRVQDPPDWEPRVGPGHPSSPLFIYFLIFPLFTFLFLSLALPIFFFGPSLPFLPE